MASHFAPGTTVSATPIPNLEGATLPVLILLILLLVPLLEIYILIEVGGVIGALPTIALCVLTALIGTALLRQQGLQTLNRARRNIDRGTVPALEMFEGVALALGGILLLTPGFATDLVGFACLIPVTRRLLVGALLRRMHVVHGPIPGRRGEAHSGQRVIEGEYKRRDED